MATTGRPDASGRVDSSTPSDTPPVAAGAPQRPPSAAGQARRERIAARARRVAAAFYAWIPEVTAVAAWWLAGRSFLWGFVTWVWVSAALPTWPRPAPRPPPADPADPADDVARWLS